MSTEYKLETTTDTYSKVKDRFSKKILDKLQKHLPMQAKILEVGPGAGHFAKECKNRGLQYSAVESSAPLRAKLEEIGIPVIDASIPPVPLDDDSTDMFFASMVLEHMPTYMDAIGFVDEAKRVLKPGGIICLTFPNAYPSGKIFWEMDYTHSYFTTPRRVTQMCEQLGFEIIEVQKTVGWFWVHSTPAHDIVRHMSNIFAAIINNSLIAGLVENIGLGGILWKFRKTFFESAIVIARKQDTEEQA